MKKIVSILFFVFLISACFADDFKFLGIPFDSSPKVVRSMMESKGWTYDDFFSTDDHLEFYGKTYAGKKINSISFSFYNNKFKSLLIMFDSARYDGTEVFIALVEKYNLVELDKNSLTYSSQDKKNIFKLYNGSIIITGGENDRVSTLDETDL